MPPCYSLSFLHINTPNPATPTIAPINIQSTMSSSCSLIPIYVCLPRNCSCMCFSRNCSERSSAALTSVSMFLSRMAELSLTILISLSFSSTLWKLLSVESIFSVESSSLRSSVVKRSPLIESEDWRLLDFLAWSCS